MSTGARRFDLSFLWMHRKLISAIGTPAAGGPEGGRPPGDEGHQAPGGAHADAHVPLPVVPRGLERPSQELRGVVEPEHPVVILHIMLCQERVQLSHFALVRDIAGAPLEGVWQPYR